MALLLESFEAASVLSRQFNSNFMDSNTSDKEVGDSSFDFGASLPPKPNNLPLLPELLSQEVSSRKPSRTVEPSTAASQPPWTMEKSQAAHENLSQSLIKHNQNSYDGQVRPQEVSDNSCVGAVAMETCCLGEFDRKGHTKLQRLIFCQDWEAVAGHVSECTSRSCLRVRSDYDETPLHVLALTSDQPLLARSLIESEAIDPCGLDREGNTALHLCCLYGRTGMIYVLLLAMIERLTLSSFQEEIERYNLQGLNCFLLAGSNGQSCAMRLLQSAGCDVTSGDLRSGRTVLHHGVAAGNILLVRFLLRDLRCEPNPRDMAGCTPLALLNAEAHPDVAAVLHQFGAAL